MHGCLIGEACVLIFTSNVLSHNLQLIKERAVEDALDEVDHLNASSASASSFVSTPPHYGASANSTTSPHPASLATAVGSRPPTASAEGKLSAAVRSSSGGRMPQKELLVSHPARPSRADGAPAPSFASAAAGCLSKDASIALCNRIMEVRSQIEFEAQCERVSGRVQIFSSRIIERIICSAH